jgi:MFS superfamily sulfate permease-like transporter
MSAFINGVVTLFVVMVALRAFAYIPTPCIAAVLVSAAVRMCPFNAMVFLWKKDKENLAILILVFLICILVDGAIGLVVGIVVCLLRNADRIGCDYVVLEHYKDGSK